MKQVLLIIAFTLSTLYSKAQSAAITTDGSSADASAMLDVKSTNKGMLVPRMTTAQRTAIASPAKGLLVFDNDTGDFWFYNGTAWTSLTSGESTNVWKKNADTIYNTNNGSVGIGLTNSLDAKFHINDNDITYKNHFLFTSGLTKHGLSIYSRPITSDNFNMGLGFNVKQKYGKLEFIRMGKGYAGYFTHNAIFGTLQYGVFESGNAGEIVNSSKNLFIIDPLNGVTISRFNQQVNQSLTVNGNSEMNGSLIVDTAGYFKQRVGIGTIPTSTYALDVDGGPSRFRTDTRIDGVLNPNNTLNIGNNATVEGSLTVNNGKGVAYNLLNSTNLKIAAFTTGEFFAVLPAHGLSAETSIVLPAGFSSAPKVIVADIETTGGTSGTLYMVELVLYDCTTTSCKARLRNNSSSSVNYSIKWNCVAIGN